MAAQSRRVTVVRAAGRGSGYLLAPRLVLTAAHVLGDHDHAWVQLIDRRPETLCSVAWRRRDPPWDAALLEAGEDLADRVPPVRWGHAVTDRPRRDCQALGFPAVDVAGASAKPNLSQAVGTYAPGPEFTADRYALMLDLAPAGGRSPWAGMSGAALWSEDFLLGVVVVDRTDWQHGRLEAVPAYLLLADTGFGQVVARHDGQRPVLEAADLAEMAEPAQPRRVFRSLSALLHPDGETVRFRGREAELAGLMAWCGTEPGVRVRLLTGPGGAGKSRLARELVHRLSAGHWTIVHLAKNVPAAAYGPLAEVSRPLLIVVDYAEARPDLAKLLGVLDSAAGSAPVRLVLLARAAGDWLSRLRAESLAAGDLLGGLTPMPVLPLAEELADRERAYDDAVEDLAAHLGRVEGLPRADWSRAAAAATRPDVSATRYGSALTLHMSALAALLAVSRQTAPPAGLSVEAQLLWHEQRYWRTSAARRRALGGLGEDTLDSCVAAATLVTPVTRSRTDALLAHVPRLDGQTRDVLGEAAGWLHDLYPAQAGGYCGALQPDRLGEYHIAECVSRDETLLPTVLPALDHDEAVRALTVIGRAAEHPTYREDLRQALIGVLTRHPVRLAPAAMTAAGQVSDAAPLLDALTALTDTTDDPQILADLHNRAPKSSLTLAPWIDRLADALVRLHRIPAGEDLASRRDLAISLNNRSNRLADLGQLDEALSATEEAVTIFRALAEAQPGTYLPYLAQALTNRAADLGRAGRRHEALATAEEAVGIFLDPGQVLWSHLPLKAVALSARSTALSALGRREEALDSIEQAVKVRRELARTDPGLFLPDLASSLSDQAVSLRELGRSQEGLAVIEEAVRICRKLATERPDEFLPSLALSLGNQAIFLADLGQSADGLVPAMEAVRIYQEVVARRPAAFLFSLSMALNNLSAYLDEAGLHEEALAAVDEAIAIRRRLAEQQPRAILPDLAMSLRNRAKCLAQLDRPADALAAIEEAAGFYRQLAEERPDTILPDLAMSLHNQALCLKQLGRRHDALAAIEEAAGFYRQLASSAPEAFAARLADAERFRAELLQ